HASTKSLMAKSSTQSGATAQARKTDPSRGRVDTEGRRQTGSRAGGAYQQLFDSIRRGELAPGSRVGEAALATRLGISRTPVRDALQRLESDGLLVHEPRVGLVVRRLSKREIIELYAMRAVLEGAAARMAAQHASDAEILELDELNRAMRDAGGDLDAMVDANRDFHLSLYHAAKNPFLLTSVTALNHALALLGGTTIDAQGRVGQAADQHDAIIDALRRRDGDAAQAAAEEHMASAQRIRMRMLRERPPADPHEDGEL
ncbi:MAG: GntR family transcriptional regulator, partial [Pseudomonadota bacterium]